MHKFAKQIAECLKSKVEGKGIDNLNLSEVEELKAWSEIIKTLYAMIRIIVSLKRWIRKKKKRKNLKSIF